MSRTFWKLLYNFTFGAKAGNPASVLKSAKVSLKAAFQIRY